LFKCEALVALYAVGLRARRQEKMENSLSQEHTWPRGQICWYSCRHVSRFQLSANKLYWAMVLNIQVLGSFELFYQVSVLEVKVPTVSVAHILLWHIMLPCLI